MDGHDVEVAGDSLELFFIGVNQDDILAFSGETFADMEANLAGADYYDTHGFLPWVL
jgi:hypothetical protein